MDDMIVGTDTVGQRSRDEVAHTKRATILRHRDTFRIPSGHIPMARRLAYSELVLAILRAGGVPDHLAVLRQHVPIATADGFTRDKTRELSEPPPDPLSTRSGKPLSVVRRIEGSNASPSASPAIHDVQRRLPAVSLEWAPARSSSSAEGCEALVRRRHTPVRARTRGHGI
jgi:hypothetical protein